MVPAVPSSVWTCFCASLQRECHLAQGDPLSCAVPLSLFMPVLWFAQSNAHPGGAGPSPLPQNSPLWGPFGELRAPRRGEAAPGPLCAHPLGGSRGRSLPGGGSAGPSRAPSRSGRAAAAPPGSVLVPGRPLGGRRRKAGLGRRRWRSGGGEREREAFILTGQRLAPRTEESE